jgi:hypothetical protein
MSIKFQTIPVDIPEQTGPPNLIAGKSDTFGSTVKDAECCIKGWKVMFSDSDHPFQGSGVEISNITTDSNVVHFKVKAGLKDHSGNYDDKYRGHVEVLVIADVADN